MGGARLDRLSVLNHRLDGQGHVRAGKTLVLALLAGHNGDGEMVAQELLVKAVDHPSFHDSLVLRLVRRVAFLPEKLRRTQEKARAHFPAHHVRPLVDEQRQVAVALHPAREGRADDRFRGRADHIRLRQLAARDHLCFPCLRIFHCLKAMMRHHCAFRREALRVFRLFLQIGKRDQQREVGVLVAGRLEAAVELLLDELPDPVTPWLDHHAAPCLGVFREICSLDDLLIPLGKILRPGRADGGFFCGHIGAGE